MAIAPIAGKLRRRLILDLSFSMGAGVALGYGWWYGWHVPKVTTRDAYYLQLHNERHNT
ncbi:uncharacterized protein L969DRAFT_47123 [Mixia osmundae IAM 14324]|uniref:Cytochrome c oxidase subunit 9, mitochondrial n=1 Tax=Mixia osmundae (strain CBS 9802 / IAM 14324 / JCM 22182 / KY 12970) TaxID=764103 RepID=G7E9N6_MIXOS|nr:uncharacterized protein L969DRAFT_47123 [Mixia osmundae IAM 14324]KEI39986.1 hypothetical protein L969DRAFT_47123 [Mixia osmundae IAM 14324]GAA99355.1 hypothetical protein E5Q_06050 [Mixia osmundae IAM 14324]